ncbi:MAG: GIY-YIG nuclease family protein [Akkermansiaceae bacterium]|nr:GIY-YIG nuclease family protein [Akkermansiaceae bacterium]
MGEEVERITIYSKWFVYVIRCGDLSLYTGITTDVNRRFAEHESQGAKAAKYLRGRLPLTLVYQQEIGSRSEASKVELRIKSLSRKEKLELIKALK